MRKGKKGRGRQVPWVKGETDATRGDRGLMLIFIRDGPRGVSSRDTRIGERWNKAMLLVKWFIVCGGRTWKGGGFQEEGKRQNIKQLQAQCV